ncbi:MAG: MFS transporter [Myxococcota bacterium]|jgi:POT family proton-dependent oligopeptide transporter|nr:MFS transporter [Myxococcota bacterium]
MSRLAYRTAPGTGSEMPTGIPHIIGNEAAERFSYYGMRAVLVVFMTQYLRDSAGELATLSEADATVYFHNFSSAVYFTPIFGALLADLLLGKYKTIISLSIVYCLGHVALALDDSLTGLTLGLTLIAIGAGGIKPCVSAHVGDQFGDGNATLLPRVYSYFYFSINFGAFVSMLLTPWLLDYFGPHAAFGLPGFLMMVATWVFWLGRRRFIHVPPRGGAFFKEAFSREGVDAMLRLSVIYVFFAIFWSLFDQTGSTWVLQAQKMDRVLFGVEWLPSQIQALNPLLIMLLIPLYNFVLYPAAERFTRITPLGKISVGLFITAGSFFICALIESWISAGHAPSIAWQWFAYVIITGAEVLVSVTGLEFSYTQAPRAMKSMIMSLYLMSVSLGNQVTAIVNRVISNADGTSSLEGTTYFLFFGGLMLVAAILFVPVALKFPVRSYIQESEEAA